MNALRTLSALVLLALLSTSATAANRWVLRAGAGEAVSIGRGSAIEASLVAEVKPDLWVGLESGLCKMQVGPSGPLHAIPFADASSVGRGVSSLTDGITRDRVFFLGPQVRWGSSIYAVASYGIADVRGDAGGTSYLQGGSVGLGIGGTGRFEPSAEIRQRFVSDAPPFGERRPTVSGDALTFTVGLHLR
jgi:hypothetical protein